MVKRPDYIPQKYALIEVVDAMPKLLAGNYASGANVILYPRPLTEDFESVATVFKARHDGQRTDIPLRGMEHRLSWFDGAAKKAFERIMEDMTEFEKSYAEVKLKVLFNKNYPFADTYKYHADIGDAGQGRGMCCYNAPVTEGLRNDQAVPLANALYDKASGAVPFAFAPGDLWRQASTETRAGVPPFIHRAPEIEAGALPRLVVVANPVAAQPFMGMGVAF